jgi:hypothetical protein
LHGGESAVVWKFQCLHQVVPSNILHVPHVTRGLGARVFFMWCSGRSPARPWLKAVI